MEKSLSYQVICATVHGDGAAQKEILAYYNQYINALSTVEEQSADGKIIRYIDEDMKMQIQTKLSEATMKWKAIHN